jgi:hypothetical protein
MKLSNRSRFPHPVLWTESGDYSKGSFHVDFEGQESLTTGAVRLKYSALLEEPGIAALLTSKSASAGVFVSCLETYYSRLLPITLPTGALEITAGLLRGRVILRPIVWTSGPTVIKGSEDIHPEFDSQALHIPKQSLIAIADEAVIEVGREKLARIESIFALAVNDDVPESQIALHMEDDKIQIHAARTTYERIFRLRGTTTSQAILLNSIYLPAVIDVLSCLKDAPEEFENRRWYRIFTAKLRHMDINVESEDLLVAAQRLLNSPFAAIPEELEVRSN